MNQAVRPLAASYVRLKRDIGVLPVRGGVHACIGRQLALTEAQLVVAGLLARFDIETTAGAIDDLRPAGVLQPRGDVTTTVRTR